MRTPIYVLVAALFFGGCTHYHVTPAGAPASQPDRVVVPEPEPVEPLELDIGRPSGGQLLLQTNRPAYVAIFEIIPNRGVTLIYPAASHQQNMLISGLTWVPLWWSPRRVSTSDRYIYAVAAEEPLRLSGETFEGGYFSRVLGVRIFRAESPYATMRAISRTVVPNVVEEEWAEDVQVITPTYLTESYRTVRVHCPGGRVIEVPEEMSGRIWCPTRSRVVFVEANRPRPRDYPVGRPSRPDSVYLGGRRIKVDPRPPRGPIGRIVDPSVRGRDDHRDRDDRRRAADRDERDDRDSRNERDEEAQPEKPKGGRIGDLIRAAKEREKQEREAQERAKQERDARRREAEEARRREEEEREDRRREAEERRDDRKDERRDERDARKDERDERKDERRDERDQRKDERRDERDERKEERREEPKREEPKRDEPRREEPRREEPKQQGQSRGEEKREEKREEKQEKREEPRADNREDNKRRGGVSDVIKQAKDKQEKEKGKP